MRAILLSGVAAVALSVTAATPASAQPTLPLIGLLLCVQVPAAQVQCGLNYSEDDENTQKIKQRQTAKLPSVPYGTIQLQIGANIAGDNSEGNTQKIKQRQYLDSNAYVGNTTGGNLAQFQGAANIVVEGGDDNYQKIEQSQSLTIGGGYQEPQPE
jgi:hypothetical protein